jgi:hypothetical protein
VAHKIDPFRLVRKHIAHHRPRPISARFSLLSPSAPPASFSPPPPPPPPFLHQSTVATYAQPNATPPLPINATLPPPPRPSRSTTMSTASSLRAAAPATAPCSGFRSTSGKPLVSPLLSAEFALGPETFFFLNCLVCSPLQRRPACAWHRRREGDAAGLWRVRVRRLQLRVLALIISFFSYVFEPATRVGICWWCAEQFFSPRVIFVQAKADAPSGATPPKSEG